VHNENGRLIGYNTDSIGFWKAVQEKNPDQKPIKKAFLMGMGGFARAAAAQMALQGVGEIVVANRLSEENYVASFRSFLVRLSQKNPSVKVRLIDWAPELWEDELAGCDVVANGTPNGMKCIGNLDRIFPYHALTPGAIVFDAIYEPLVTAFLKKAQNLGFATVEGLDLLVHQGTASFFNWTGVDVDPAQMKKDILRFLKKEETR
jgi:shikimate dehydrogenase